MNLATILTFLKAILPTKKIAAWIVGVIAAAIAVLMGVNNAELKAAYCAGEPVSLPTIAAPATPAK